MQASYNAPMPHLELSLRCRAKDEPWLERALTDLGAMSVTLLDPQADTTNEQAILEPGVGETPLWADCLVVALFDEDVPREPLLAALFLLLQAYAELTYASFLLIFHLIHRCMLRSCDEL
jgi:ribosomal protein L11 methyltransferase